MCMYYMCTYYYILKLPDTNPRSSIPSFLSINIAPDVKATAKKNIILNKNKTIVNMYD